MKTDKAAPRPWKYVEDSIGLLDVNNRAVFVTPDNTKLIVRAVNAHDDLVRALTCITNMADAATMREYAEDALAKVKS